MAALHEKYLWPLIGVVIFAVLTAFYIDDRRNLAQENTTTMVSQDTNANTTSSYANSSSTKKSASMHASHESKNTSRQSADNSLAGHQGFSGSIEHYLSGEESKQAATGQQPSEGVNKASSMSMDEYLAKTEGKSDHQSTQTENGYSGSIDDYLTKFSHSKQTPLSTDASYPFQTEEYIGQTEEHMGFHGSYEEYAKKYH